MKQLIKTISFTILAAGFMAPGSLLAQKEKEDKEKKEAEQIIITRKGKKDDKVVVEVIGDKVIVNGREIKNDQDDDISVKRHKIKDVWAFGGSDNFTSTFNNDHFKMFNVDENKAMLGVSTEQAEKGAEVENVTEGSAAEKAGLKEGDVITKIGDYKIESPDDLSKAIKARKPGDKVAVTFLRDKKEQTVTAELTKWKGVNVFTTVPGMENFKMDLGDFAPHVQTHPRVTTPRMNWNWSGGGPKLGISVQDTEDGKGVNVLEVDEDGNAAKAGIKEDDIITEVDSKAVNSADEIAKLVRENKDKASVKVKLLRKGKTENLEVKIPRKLKTADL